MKCASWELCCNLLELSLLYLRHQWKHAGEKRKFEIVNTW